MTMKILISSWEMALNWSFQKIKKDYPSQWKSRLKYSNKSKIIHERSDNDQFAKDILHILAILEHCVIFPLLSKNNVWEVLKILKSDFKVTNLRSHFSKKIEIEFVKSQYVNNFQLYASLHAIIIYV